MGVEGGALKHEEGLGCSSVSSLNHLQRHRPTSCFNLRCCINRPPLNPKSRCFVTAATSCPANQEYRHPSLRIVVAPLWTAYNLHHLSLAQDHPERLSSDGLKHSEIYAQYGLGTKRTCWQYMHAEGV